jgi:hypothetical protein
MAYRVTVVPVRFWSMQVPITTTIGLRRPFAVDIGEAYFDPTEVVGEVSHLRIVIVITEGGAVR